MKISTKLFSSSSSSIPPNRVGIRNSSDYSPFGVELDGRTVSGEEYRFGFQDQEKDDEIKGEGNSVNYNFRMHDSRLGRWLGVDPHFVSYPAFSPYCSMINNPINVVDPDGKDIYIIIWNSKDNETGHAAIAVDNYKTVEYKAIENGKEVTKTKRVPDGTVTYYDLWPEKPVGNTEFQTNVKDDYNRRMYYVSELTTKDVSRSYESEKVSEYGENRAPDAVIKLHTGSTDEEQRLLDKEVKEKLEKIQDSGKDYNACYNNCSTFVEAGVKAAIPNFDASQFIDVKGSASLIYHDAKVVAPNNLQNEAGKQKGSKVLKGKAKTEAKPYLEYFGK